ncbi:MAG: class I SAM-dependent methyltransferase [Burkholderiales bacterium]|nr:class I SAM-dependent methyltransferase [Burkholderiales bacterium]
MREVLARRFSSVALCALLLAGCAFAPPAPPDYAAVIAAADREDADRQIDARRKQPDLLAFTGVAPGMRVLDMGAGGGYTTELLARIVGATGRILAQDSKETIGRVQQRFDARMKKPVMAPVQRVIRDFDDPLPPGVADLDLITFFFAYHDTAFMPVDRAAMNRALFRALKPGGHLVVADHSARSGAGIGVVKSLHRIEESVVRRELEAAGFRLVADGSFLRNPADPREEIVFRAKVPVDEFVLKFVRP